MALRPDFAAILREIHKPVAGGTIWEWAEKNVDFSGAPAYETPRRTRYDAGFMPFWKEPAENLTDPEIRETWVLKCARAGGSENLLLNPMRFAVAVQPQPVLYVTADQKSAEEFMNRRIVLGMDCAPVCAKRMKRARTGEHRIYFDDMLIQAAWPKGRTAFKQAGYSLILGDELSLWPSYAADMMRGRTDTYQWSHICGISSPDAQQHKPSSQDPIFQEFEGGDQRYWFMPDPKTRRPFRFVMGTRDSVHGLKWDQAAKRADGSWDEERVKVSAHYVTEDGTKIPNAHRLGIVGRGRWVPTNKRAPRWRRSYHLNAFYLPFKKGDFGEIAVEFLRATAKGREALRVFVYEYLAEPWVEDVERAEDDLLYERQADYPRHTAISAATSTNDRGEKYASIYLARAKSVFLSVDVQKFHMWTIAREWIEGGDSGLVDWSPADSWEGIEALADKYGAKRVGVDCGYEARRFETLEYCLRAAAWPLMGRDHQELPLKKREVDPYEGRAGQGEKQHVLAMWLFDTDVFGGILLDRMRRESTARWYVYQDIERAYIQQAASMERVEGVWQMRRGHGQNHLWDCEVMQGVLATIHGFITLNVLQEIQHEEVAARE